MERSRLSIRALVVLASELGAEHLFGVRDPFMMMDHEEIRAAYEVCLEELEQSGFPAAGVADDGIGFACVKTIGDIFEYRFLRSIGKAYIF